MSRLALLEEVEPLLAGRRPLASGRRDILADKLERWRYQLLDEGCHARWRAASSGEPPAGGGTSPGRAPWQTSPRLGQLLEALDVAARQLAGRPGLPPRGPRLALDHGSAEDPVVATARRCLDSSVPVEQLESAAARATKDRFGHRLEAPELSGRHWRILLYAPVYLSSLCVNHCVYCGFSFNQKIRRRHLTVEEAVGEAQLLKQRGFQHLLLVAGDFPARTSPDYFEAVIRRLRSAGIKPGLEVAALSSGAYRRLVAAGVSGVTLYMETYQEDTFAGVHLRGPKRSFDWRLEAMERAAEAGAGRLGLGILLGLAEPRRDFMALVRHARYLETRFPGRQLAFSLPRIHAAPEEYRNSHPVDDETFVRFYCALRLAFPAAELVLSTRENVALRGRLARTCITQMSAGSSTRPGGYTQEDAPEASPQFPVADLRSPAAVSGWLKEAGLEPVWDLPS